MRAILLALLAGLITQARAAETPADAFPGVATAMSGEVYARAGLDKLTPEERAELDAWLLRYLAGEREAVRQTTRQTLEKLRQTPSEERIEARVQPPFSGWDGATVFRLDNDQIWRQRLQGRYRHAGPVATEGVEVVISRNFFGFYVLELLGTGRSVGVERLR